VSRKRVLVAMSGGVDSSVAAALLLKEGLNVTGAYLKLLKSHEDSGEKDARDAARLLGIDLLVMDFSGLFRERVLDYFAAGYLAGLTPNPCVVCNPRIKFGALMQKSIELGFDLMATGHYARVEYDDKSGRRLLKRPVDRSKDQTYVLYGLSQGQLSRTVFPLGSLRKDEVRELARSLGLFNAQKPDSQDLCFVKQGGYADFVEAYTGTRMAEGEFVGLDGRVMGRHKGIARYTVGQRKGLSLSLPEPAYVVAKDSEKNRVVLGRESDLFKSVVWVGSCNFIPFDSLKGPLAVTAKLRYGQREQKAVLRPEPDGRVRVEFETPQRAPAPGQAAVFYDGDILVGGGTIIDSK